MFFKKITIVFSSCSNSDDSITCLELLCLFPLRLGKNSPSLIFLIDSLIRLCETDDFFVSYLAVASPWLVLSAGEEGTRIVSKCMYVQITFPKSYLLAQDFCISPRLEGERSAGWNFWASLLRFLFAQRRKPGYCPFGIVWVLKVMHIFLTFHTEASSTISQFANFAIASAAHNVLMLKEQT